MMMMITTTATIGDDGSCADICVCDSLWHGKDDDKDKGDDDDDSSNINDDDDDEDDTKDNKDDNGKFADGGDGDIDAVVMKMIW